VVTNVPEVASELERRGAGAIIEYSADDLARAVIDMMTSQHLDRFQANAYAMAADYDWNTLFARAIGRSTNNGQDGI
jgi:UDP:flavonoid glycosyltransferase YjiC (YdhE family)